MSPTRIDASKAVPRLDAGLAVLCRPPSRSPALHRLVVNELGRVDGTTYWIDSGNEASTIRLCDVARTDRVLDDLRVARGFTAHQHHALVRRVVRRASAATGLVVAPNVAALYRADDVPDWEGRDLLESALATLAEVAATYEVPVLVSTARDDEAAALATEYADTEIECRRTDQGLAYETDDFETQVYWRAGYWQTTIPYWVDLLGAVGADPATAAVAAGWPEVEG